MIRAATRFFVRSLTTLVRSGFLQALLEDAVHWRRTPDVNFPYESTFQGRDLRLRINDFPDEPAYTVIDSQSNAELMHTNAFRGNWTRGTLEEAPPRP